MRAVALSVLLLAVAGCDTHREPGAPRSATILKVTVDAAPLADPTGAGWDGDNPLSDGPEVYFRLFDDAVDYRIDPGSDRLNPRDDAAVFALGSEQPWFEDVETRDFPLVWDVDPGAVVRDLDDPLYVALFDYDPTTGDDPMAESEVFVLRDLAPATVTGRADVIRLFGFDRNGDAIDDVEVRLTVEFFD